MVEIRNAIPLALVMTWARLATAGPSSVMPSTMAYSSCRDDASKYAARSEELQRIVAADQADRPNNVLKPGAQLRDRERRARVGAIFGEGCFKEARDFSAAALVFQHGDQPEHFMQTFIWAKRSIDLGDSSQGELMTEGIDRYLVSTGHRQLFASQFFKASLARDACFCLEQTEASFPDALRLKFQGKTYAQRRDESLKVLNAGAACAIAECARPLQPTPAGSVPGIW